MPPAQSGMRNEYEDYFRPVTEMGTASLTGNINGNIGRFL